MQHMRDQKNGLLTHTDLCGIPLWPLAFLGVTGAPTNFKTITNHEKYRGNIGAYKNKKYYERLKKFASG